MTAYKGTTVPNFPNLFFIVGPNVGLGHSSMVFMIESQVAYIRDALKTMRKAGYDVVEVDQAATDRYNEALQERMKRTVWSVGGCDSWYLDAHGKNTTLWPRSTIDFRRRLASFDASAYTLSTTAASPQPERTPSHEVPRRQGRRDHGRRLRIGRALALTWPDAARCWHCPTRRGRPRRDRGARRGGRCARGPQRPR